MDFWKGAIMSQTDVLELTGQEPDSDIFTIYPTGNLIHVLLEKPPEEIGMIKIPEYLVDLEKMGVGYIIAVGPMAGAAAYANPSPSPIGVTSSPEKDDPASLLGLHVIFGSHAGMPLRVNVMDREFRAPVLVMTAKDIRGVDTNPVSLTTRVVERSKE